MPSHSMSVNVIDKATVELDIFSGAKNPQWSLSMDDFQTLMRMLKSLQPVESADFFSGLGFRGFRVTIAAGSSKVVALWVQGKYVERKEDGKPLYFIDEGCRLERWLLATGEKQIDHDLYLMIEDGFNRSDYCGGAL